jgi:hypothetical protein
LVVYDQLVINTQPTDQTLCLGSNATFSVNITGPANREIEWYHNGVLVSNGGRISGATSTALNITAIDLTDAGNYECLITSSCGTVTSNTVSLTIHEPLAFSTQPQDATGCPGSIVALNVSATGNPINYAWFQDGNPVGTNSPAYTIPAFAATDAGDYTCQITNICGTVTSNIAEVKEGFTTALTDPADLTRCEGQNALFQITANGSNLLYQWNQNGNPISNDGHFGGTQTTDLSITNLVLSDEAAYNCVVTGSCGTVIGNIASLTVNELVAITVNPVSISVLTGNNTSFTVVASGDITGYQWRKNGVDLIDGGSISGATTNNLIITGVAAIDADVYTCLVSGSCNSVISNPANLTVLASSVITLQPTANLTKCEGEIDEYFHYHLRFGTYYQWQKGGANLSGNVRILGVNTASLTIK